VVVVRVVVDCVVVAGVVSVVVAVPIEVSVDIEVSVAGVVTSLVTVVDSVVDSVVAVWPQAARPRAAAEMAIRSAERMCVSLFKACCVTHASANDAEWPRCALVASTREGANPFRVGTQKQMSRACRIAILCPAGG
jgi:hypothetical protein